MSGFSDIVFGGKFALFGSFSYTKTKNRCSGKIALFSSFAYTKTQNWCRGKPDVPSPRPRPTYLGTFDSCMVDVRICWSSWWESECSLLMMMMCLLMNTYTVKLNWNRWVIVHVNALVDACRQLCVRMLRFLVCPEQILFLVDMYIFDDGSFHPLACLLLCCSFYIRLTQSG